MYAPNASATVKTAREMHCFGALHRSMHAKPDTVFQVSEHVLCKVPMDVFVH